MTKNSLAILAIAATCLAVPVGPALAKSVLDYGRDGREYFLAPLHWETHDWEIAGGVVLGIAASHLLDGTVRDQFRPTAMGVGIGRSTRDALPLAALFAGTLAVGVVGGDRRMLHTTWDMGEAVALSSLSAQALKVAFGRRRPRQTSSPNRWRSGGSSFPSGHTTVVFAAAQVLADELPPEKTGWRALAYGLAGVTALGRMDSHAHWLSDTVAGAALGIVTGRFVARRRWDESSRISFSITPSHGGAMLTVSMEPH